MTGKFPVPPAVREAVAKALYEHWWKVTMQGPPWEKINDDWRNGTLGQADAGIAALFAAWPGMHREGYIIDGQVWNVTPGSIILPLPPQEASDE